MADALSFSSLMGGAKSGKSGKSIKSGKSGKSQKGGSALAQTGGEPKGVESALTQSLTPLQMGGRSRRYRKSKTSRRPKKSLSRKSKRRSPSKGAFPNGIFRNVFK